VMNSQFLQEEKVGHVVNTARGLEIFGPKYLVGGALFTSSLAWSAIEGFFFFFFIILYM